MKRREFLDGVADLAPVLVAVVPIGLLWGTLASAKGLSVLEAMLMSVLVFAGAAQFVAVEMWQHPAPVLLLVLAALIVNIRHVLMSASVSRHLEKIPRRLHPIIAYLLVDESWALTERRALKRPVTLAYYLGVTLPMAVSWYVSTGVGAVLGRSLGDPAAIGLDFAFSALFVSILMGFWKGRRTAGVLAASGGVAAATYLAIDGPWYIMAGGLAGALAAALSYDGVDRA